MNGPFNPLVIAQAVTRNIVPLVGILAFHWPAGNVLILYLLDTLLADRRGSRDRARRGKR
jgi:hypothetical protein